MIVPKPRKPAGLQVLLAAALCLQVCCGATCIPKRTLSEFQPPILFETPPQLPELAAAINRSSAIEQLSSPAVTVRLPDLPALSATLDWQRDANFRMKGGVSRLTGTDFDLGSNPNIFWMSSRHDLQPTLYYARHDLFASQMQRQVLPVSPLWLVEALGVVTLNPDLVTEVPQQAPDGLIHIASSVPSPIGNYRRTLHVDPKEGTVRQILLNDPSGRLLASALLSEHQYYSTVQTSLPHRSEVQLMPIGGSPLALQLEVGFYRVNDDAAIDPEKFASPPPDGFRIVDLAGLNAGSPSAVQMPAYQAAAPAPPPAYRGVELTR